MAFGADNVQASRTDDVLVRLDIRATAGHVRGDGYTAATTRHGYDLRLATVLASIEHLMFNAYLSQKLAQALGFFDGTRADQDRSALIAQSDDFVDHLVE